MIEEDWDVDLDWFSSDGIFNSKINASFGELLQTGWDWGRDKWTTFTVSDENLEVLRPILNERIEDTYYMRELSIEIPGRWKKLFVRKIEESLDKHGYILDQLINEPLDLSGLYEVKSRTATSEYPQSMLSPTTNDYLTDATEHGLEAIRSIDTVQALSAYKGKLNFPISNIIDDLDVMFSHYPYFLSLKLR